MSAYAKRVEGIKMSSPSAAVESSGMSPENKTIFGHPRALFILFFTEMWERFSYYGMRALLILYMINALGYSTQKAGSIYGLYTGLVFVTPIFGGYLADRFLGQRRAILIGGALIALGQFALVFEPETFFYGGLALLIVGNGFFKPNISVIVGHLYKANDPRRDSAFSIFYMGINVGGTLSPLICGYLGQKAGYGWHWGFGAAGVGMVLGLVMYLFNQGSLGEHGKQPVKRTSTMAPRAKLTAVDWQRMLVLGILGIFGNIIFWAAFEQAGASLSLFAERATDLHVGWLNWTMPSSWMQSANPAFIIALAPVFSWIWMALSRARWEPSTPAKFVMGLSLVSLGFVVMMLGGARFDDTQLPVSMGWLLAAYLLNTCGELCLAPVGLSTVTKLAPSHLGSLMMGAWFFSMAIGNWLGGNFAGNYDSLSKATFFSIPAATAGAAALLLLLLVKPLRKMMHGVH